MSLMSAVDPQPLPHLRHNPADDGFVDGAVGEEGGHVISLLEVVKASTVSSAFSMQYKCSGIQLLQPFADIPVFHARRVCVVLAAVEDRAG